MNLSCTNPNYIEVKAKHLPHVKNQSRVQFLNRETYLKRVSNLNYQYYQTRCGKCLACQIFRSYQWSNRLQAEAIDWKYSYFLTFTFDDENIQKVDLEKPNREFQLFMKRLRKKFPIPMKYYTVSEFGGQTLRFHYHSILFVNEDLFSDKYLYERKKYDYFRSPILEKIWGNGNVILANSNPESMRYTANYINKMSNSHCFSKGLGENYIQKNSENNQYVISGKYSQIPRYLKTDETKIVDLNISSMHEYFLNQKNYEFNESRAEILKKHLFIKKT